MHLIDADAVPQEFWEYEFDGKWRGCTIKDLLDSQPTVHPEPHWIPVTERMPEEYGEYMFTWTSSQFPNQRFIGIAEYEVTSKWDAENARWEGEWLFDDYMNAYADVTVTAWMPLPELYKGGEEDED